MLFRVAFFVIAALLAGLQMEETQQSLGILEDIPILRAMLSAVAGIFAGILALYSIPGLQEASTASAKSPSLQRRQTQETTPPQIQRNRQRSDIVQKSAIRQAPVSQPLPKSTRKQRKQSRSKPEQVKNSKLTPVAIMFSMMNFILIYSMLVDMSLFLEFRVSFQIVFLYLILAYVLALSFTWILMLLQGTGGEKRKFLSITSIGGAFGIGLFVARTQTGLLNSLFVFVWAYISGWILIFIFSGTMLLWFAFLRDLILSPTPEKTARTLRRSLAVFSIAYFVFVCLSVADLWLPLALA